MDKSTFLAKITDSANLVKDLYGIAPVITKTQAAHESGWGNSALTALANNLFGYTANASWKGAVYQMPTTEYSNYPPEKIHYWNKPGDIISKVPYNNGTKLSVAIDFRRYENWDDSCKDWASNIVTLLRYSAAYGFAKQGDLEGYAKAVQLAGYATDPHYAESLILVGKQVQNG